MREQIAVAKLLKPKLRKNLNTLGVDLNPGLSHYESKAPPVGPHSPLTNLIS